MTCINGHDFLIIDYLLTENQVYREVVGKKRLRVTDAQRRRLAMKGKLLGRKLLGQFASIVTPDTILRRHRRLIAMKWDYSAKRSPGRPRLATIIRRLVVRFALENRHWGYGKVQGAFEHLGHTISTESIANILRENGIEPAPERSKRKTWNEFLRTHRNRSLLTENRSQSLRICSLLSCRSPRSTFEPSDRLPSSSPRADAVMSFCSHRYRRLSIGEIFDLLAKCSSSYRSTRPESVSR